jgi:hypothetical protein
VLKLNELGVDLFIKRAKNIHPYWDNYDLIIWKKDSSGIFHKRGKYTKNSWGIAERISVGENGVWELPKKYVKYFK